jgi:hypothetical protein
MNVLLQDSDADILLVQEPWFYGITPRISDSDPSGIPVHGPLLNDLWHCFLPAHDPHSDICLVAIYIKPSLCSLPTDSFSAIVRHSHPWSSLSCLVLDIHVFDEPLRLVNLYHQVTKDPAGLGPGLRAILDTPCPQPHIPSFRVTSTPTAASGRSRRSDRHHGPRWSRTGSRTTTSKSSPNPIPRLGGRIPTPAAALSLTSSCSIPPPSRQTNSPPSPRCSRTLLAPTTPRFPPPGRRSPRFQPTFLSSSPGSNSTTHNTTHGPASSPPPLPPPSLMPHQSRLQLPPSSQTFSIPALPSFSAAPRLIRVVHVGGTLLAPPPSPFTAPFVRPVATARESQGSVPPFVVRNATGHNATLTRRTPWPCGRPPVGDMDAVHLASRSSAPPTT